MIETLTDKTYWEDYWKAIQIPVLVNESFSNDRVIAEFLKAHVKDSSGRKTALEIGCAPGKWMIFLAQILHYLPDGVEYLHTAVEKTRENLAMEGVTTASVFEGDFCTLILPEKSYDLVLALGFIEHFTDPVTVIERMLHPLKPGGTVILGIPKFTGINRWLASEVDKTQDYQLLAHHNLSIMNKKFFENLSHNLPLRPLAIDYVGGFEPALFNISRTTLWFRILFRGISLLLDNPLLRTLGLEWYAGYIMAAYEKR